MDSIVNFGLAISNSYPSGTGSYSYEGSFKIVVQNLAYFKNVSIVAQFGSLWKEIIANYAHSLPDNRELWIAPANDSEGEFVAKYTVNGITYWDNNGGLNYKFPQAFDDFAVLAGNNYKVVMGNVGLAGNMIHLNIGVQNLAYTKVVGIVYTTNNWINVQTAFAHYSSTMISGLEVWNVDAPIGSATEVKFAIFYQVLGSEYWDNNFNRNYTVTKLISPEWGGI